MTPEFHVSDNKNKDQPLHYIIIRSVNIPIVFFSFYNNPLLLTYTLYTYYPYPIH